MYKVKSMLNPAIFKSPKTGKTFIIAGSQPWIEVPEGTTLADVQWNPTHEPEKGASTAPNKIFEVEGSKGNMYTVKCNDGEWTCTCPGYGFRRRCRHINEKKVKNFKGE